MTAHDDAAARTLLQTAPGAARGVLPGEQGEALPAATRLHEFEIVSVIGQGGFGIVYLAHDLMLDRRVAIKEYMPSAMAVRSGTMNVSVRSARHAEAFAAGLRSFVNEARLLAKFDHPALLKVHRFWEAHGTAYMVMPHYAGITLARQLAAAPGPPDEARLRGLLGPLLDALALMHAADCYHRDIAPDNILVLPDGAPLLLDFGAARRVIGNMTDAPTVILKPGYAPVEQYGGMPEMTQGAWTDLYALGSVIEFAITGRTPPQAVARLLADKRQPLASACAGHYSEGFLRAIDRALAVLPKDRPQSVAAMQALLASAPAPARALGRVDPPRPVAGGSSAGRSERSPEASPRTGDAAPRSRHGGPAIAALATTIALIASVGVYVWVVHPAERSPRPSTGEALRPPSARAPRSPPPEAASAGGTDAPSASADVGAVTPRAPSASRDETAAALRTSPAAIDETEATVPAPSAAPAPPPTTTVGAEPEARQDAPAARSTGAARQPRSANPAKRAAAPVGGEAESVAPERQPVPGKRSLGARCADIIERVSLGEPLSGGDKLILTQECRR